MLERQYVVASFLHKLWSMLEDPANAPIISWSDDGSSFVVHDQARFAMEILPKFYKHNNMASFIRQLNMYGFSKISHDPSHNALYTVKSAEATSVEFQHPQFIRGQPDLVASIKRKTTVGTHAGSPTQQPVTSQQQIVTQQQFPTQNLQNDPMAIRVLSEVQQLHKKHDSFSNQLEQLRHENEVLWREMAALRQKCHNQQAIISKVVNFLVSVIGGNNGSGLNAVGGGSKRSFPMIESDHSRPTSTQAESSPAKVSKRFDFKKNNNSGLMIQEIVEDEAAASVEDVAESGFVAGLGGVELPAVSAEYQEPAVEPPVKVVPLPTAVQPGRPEVPGPFPPSPEAPSFEQIPSAFFLNNSDDFNRSFDNMQLDLDQLKTNLRSYFNDQSPTHVNEDFLSDLFNTEQPLPELESPLPSPRTLATPGVPQDDDDVLAPGNNTTQLIRYLPPNYYLTSSADPLLYSQPSTSGAPPMQKPPPPPPTGRQ